jgi:hypothetical protein
VSPDANHVWRYDPKTGKRIASVATHVQLGAANVADGSLWASNRGTNTVWREPLG